MYLFKQNYSNLGLFFGFLTPSTMYSIPVCRWQVHFTSYVNCLIAGCGFLENALLVLNDTVKCIKALFVMYIRVMPIFSNWLHSREQFSVLSIYYSPRSKLITLIKAMITFSADLLIHMDIIRLCENYSKMWHSKCRVILGVT